MIFAGRKYLVKNICTKSFHEVMESGGWLVNQCLARSLSDNGSRRNLKASFVTPLYLTVSDFNKTGQMCIWILIRQPMKLYIVEHLQSYSFQLKVVRLNR